ncbi:MAG TPA: hypothetical protein PLY00_15550 [Verrucomicrobiota bacterium]|nr:hypothetical protein [Verrucomicrobiota bacterium]HOR72675.1 hypothetical protein [Verrucomicrobiota bacterium]HOU87242.1 hypothetical protein [Verrucomicrobiota bacterium]HPK97347.1 hypothetical protein [Verrucomicrobiota bacterium]HQI32134.1 hypothetical protein [Verrucomicrobiota bacterium]
MGIGEVFQQFCDNLKITNGESISYPYRRITNQLNRTFFGYENDTYHSIYTGSYGRDTAIEGIQQQAGSSPCLLTFRRARLLVRCPPMILADDQNAPTAILARNVNVDSRRG